ncbi:hypothetical protein P8C59_003190 [Phyllachora maydis]|uniref:Aldehyde dehydrogenase n=1 Tax=Phyllachora maydis TaxID=1825666 RepID=A0AAD9I1C4_9PEZI|nr:hypothetical protein P8C59_003190 [Phyllachora maydis]
MAAKVSIPEFQTTAHDAIPAVYQAALATFRTNKTKDVEWRRVQLRRLYWALVDYEPALLEALYRDLHKSQAESRLTEVEYVKGECLFLLKQLDRLVRDDALGVPDVPLPFKPMNVRIRKEPLGTVLVIGPYNYPLMLLLSPLLGAIAAGCTAVLKPSELAPATAMVVTDLLAARLDRAAFAVVNGAVAETTALLGHKWDKIFFTGSAAVGTIVARKAAETLTPVCLELGGRNPAFVTRNAHLALAARRLLWGKTLNAGQVCMSANYILVDRAVVDSFIHFLHAAYRDMFPHGAKASPDLVRIVNARHFARIKKILDTTRGRIVLGGQVDEADLFIEPTAVLVDSPDDPAMAEETFGPVWSIYPYDTLEQAIEIANGVHRTPLGLYSFGTKAENEKVLGSTTSGGASLNDAYMHGSINTVPFGGVGDSGWGAYHGKASFDTFTHFRTVAETPAWAEVLLRVRYIPYNTRLIDMFAKGNSNPGFDRNGQVVRGLGYWAGLLLGLGTTSLMAAVLRWLVVASAWYFYTTSR